MHLRLDLEYFRAGAASGVGLPTRGDHVLRIKELRFGRLLLGIVNLFAFVLGGKRTIRIPQHEPDRYL